MSNGDGRSSTPGRHFAFGYKRDPYDPNDYRAERLLGRPLETDLVVPASLMSYRTTSLQQGRAGSCVAHALCRAIDVALRCSTHRMEYRDGLPPPPLASRRFMYFNARRQEAVETFRRGLPAPVMTDSGAYPRLAMRAVQRLGFCPESVFPYSDDPTAISAMPRAEVYREAYDQTGFRYYRIDTIGRRRIADVARALARGNPVIFGMMVDSAFMGWDGVRPIDVVNVNDPESGGHMMCALEVTHDRVIADNWWGDDWGAGGFAHLSHRLFGSEIVSDVYVIEAAPAFSNSSEETMPHGLGDSCKS